MSDRRKPPLEFGRDSTFHEQAGEHVRKALARSMGYTQKDLDKPLVGVIHGWNEISPGHYHLKLVAMHVKLGISAAGGTPVEVIVPGICGSMSGGRPSFRYNVPYRDFAAALVEIMINVNLFDGVVLIGTCPSTLPAYLMGAARTNVPSIFVTAGYMEPGEYKNRLLTNTDVMVGYGEFLDGKINKKALEDLVDKACPTPGTCGQMGTGITNCFVTEALGMSLPGNASIPANTSQLLRFAREAGETALKLIREDIKPSEIMTKQAFENAIKLVLATGASPNATIHITAIARQLGIDLDLGIWDRLSKETPFICSIRPSQPQYTMRELEKAGGIRAVMKELMPLLHNIKTVNGRTAKQNVEDAKVENREIIRPLNDPFSKDGGLAVLKGNLAPDGAIVKHSAVPKSLWKYSGKVKIFNSEIEAIKRLTEGEIKAKDLVVIRYEGPKGSPGALEIMNFMHCLCGMGLEESVGVVTDGRVSGSNYGLVVVHVSPEAQEGGPIAIVENGDEICIDIPRREIRLNITNRELQARLSRWNSPESREKSGVLGAYAKWASSLSKGAVLF